MVGVLLVDPNNFKRVWQNKLPHSLPGVQLAPMKRLALGPNLDDDNHERYTMMVKYEPPLL